MPETPSPAPNEKHLKALRQKYGLEKSGDSSAALSAVGFELAGIFGALALIGWGLDKYFNTAPWLLLAGCLIGIVGGLYRLILKVGR